MNWLVIFSALEKYSFAFLQLLSTALITMYFGIESLGMIGSFTLLIATSIIISEAGSSFLILGCNDKDLEYTINNSLLIALILGILQFILLLCFGNFYTEMLNSNIEYSSALKYYGIIMISSPVQLIYYSAIIRLGKIKILTKINIISWIIAIFILNIYILSKQNDHRMVVWYFITLSLSRCLISFYYASKHIDSYDFNLTRNETLKRLSLVSSGIANTITANIWLSLVAINVNMSANGVLSLFTKLRDLSIGNLAHALHRVVYSKLPTLPSTFHRKLIRKYFIYFLFITILLSFSIYIFSGPLMKFFSVKYSHEYLKFIYFSLGIGLFFPFTDYLKAILRYYNQKVVLIIEATLMIIICLTYLREQKLSDLMFLFLGLNILISTIIFWYVKKATRA